MKARAMLFMLLSCRYAAQPRVVRLTSRANMACPDRFDVAIFTPAPALMVIIDATFV